MNTIGHSNTNFVDVTSTALKRNIASYAIDAKKSGAELNKEQLSFSNQEIKDKSRQAAVSFTSVQQQQENIDTYLKSSQQNSEQPEKVNTETNTFDANEVNEVRNTVQKRAVVVDVYEKVDEHGRGTFGSSNQVFSITV